MYDGNPLLLNAIEPSMTTDALRCTFASKVEHTARFNYPCPSGRGSNGKPVRKQLPKSTAWWICATIRV